MQPLCALSAAVEGPLDEVVLSRVAEEAQCALEVVHGRNGKKHLLSSLAGYNNAARHHPWVVLVDLDTARECAPTVREQYLSRPAQYMVFRLVVREIEAWLLADAAALSGFLGVPQGLVPSDPESVADPKQVMVNLARRARKREIREDMVPRPGSGRSVGPGYTSQMIEFALTRWRPQAAAEVCGGVSKCIRRIEETCKRFGQ